MVGRSKVRKDPDGADGPDGWGVCDSAANGWRGPGLTEDQADATADELDLQDDAHGPRPADSVRRLDPGQPVDRADWQLAGALEVWLHDRGQWFGRVRDATGDTTWIPAADLHPHA
jgi:hypothetical protein